MLAAPLRCLYLQDPLCKEASVARARERESYEDQGEVVANRQVITGALMEKKERIDSSYLSLE